MKKFLLELMIVLGAAGMAMAQQGPDLTVGTTRFAVLTNQQYYVNNYSPGGGHILYTYNLGPTGLRGWIYVLCNQPNLMDNYTTNAPFQILVTSVGTNTPASSLLFTNDVILGVKAGLPPVSLFTNDTRRALGNAITDAEAGNGQLSFLVNRYGASSNVNVTIQLAITNMAYSTTAPYNCPKSTLILSNALNVISKNVDRSQALALLASGNTNYLPQVQSYARSIAPTNLVLGWPTYQGVGGGMDTWTMGYRGLFLAEYYMVTHDAQVTNALTQYIVGLAKSDTMWGCYGHGGAKVMPYHVAAGVHGYGAGYGPVNACGMLCKLAIAVAQKTGIPSIVNNPEVQPSIDRSINFYGYYVQKGSVPYGEMPPYLDNHCPIGKDGLPALFFGVLGNQPTQAQYFTRLSVASHHSREWGHAGGGWSLCWDQLGTVMGGTNAAAAYAANTRWYQELARRSDGSFAYECPGDSPSTASDYWDYEDYQGFLDPTAWNALFLSAPKQALYITGKNANPTNYLTDAAVSNAVWAGLYDLNMSSYSTNQLIAHLGEYQPSVRLAAAQQLASLCATNAALSSALVPTLIALTTDTNPWVRSAACEALGMMQCTNALNALAARMYDSDVWVRFKANNALDQLGTAALPQLTNIMTAFTTYASPDPLVSINWSDPCGWGNGCLSHLLFQTLADSTINQSTNLLYPVLIAGLRQPDRQLQSQIGSIIRNQLRWQDVQALAASLMAAASKVSQANEMYGSGAVGDVLACLAKYGVDDGLAALAVMTDSGFATDGQTPINFTPIYRTYGTEASQLLPTLYNMETVSSNTYAGYVATLQSNANNLPAVHSFKQFSVVSATPSSIYISAATNVVLNVAASDLSGWGLRYAWSVAQGPGTVSLSNPTNANCTASFSAPGVYVLQAAAAPIMDRNLFWDPTIPGGGYIYGTPMWTFSTWTNFYGATYTNVIVTVIGGLPAVNNAGGATYQTVTSATLQGLLTAGGGANVWICWGDNDAGINSTSAWDNVQAVGFVSQGTVFSVPVTGLATNTTYFYRWFGTNEDGQAWSAAATSFSAVPAAASWYGMKISFTNYNRAETLTNFPALVVFSNGMAGATFDFGTFLSTNGYDLRFTDSTGLTNLNYEIENWSSGGSNAYVWVQVPRFSSNCCVWAKWGNILQTNQLACTTNGAAWDSTFKGVWHFPAGAGLSALDSTSNKNNGTIVSATATTGVIGGGMNATTGQYIDLPNSNNTLNVSTGDWTMQGWAKPSASLHWVNLVNAANVYGIAGGANSRWSLLQADNIVACADSDPDGSFQHVMATRSGTAYKLYINGSLQSSVDPDGNYGFGHAYCIGLGYTSFAGSIDEVRIEGVARSSNWVWACYMNMASNSFFNTPDTVLPLSSSPIANFAPTSITSNSATLNAYLSAPGTNYAVTVYWGTTNGGTNTGAWMHSASVGSWTNVALTNITYQASALSVGTTYYYVFRATNATTTVWATPSWQFLTLDATTPVASLNAYLSNLVPSVGTLSPTFASNTLNYAESVLYATTSLAVTPTAADDTATITVNGSAVASGSSSGAIALNVGDNVINTVVVSQDLSTTNTYTLTVTRAPASANASLSNLVPSAGTLSPTFASNTFSYAENFLYATTNLTVTPTVADATASVTVNGVAVPSGTPSGPINLSVGTNTITTVVTAQNGVTTQTYTLTVTRAAASANANLANLVPSAGTLSPAFASTTFSYTDSVTFATSSMTVTPTAADATATINVNGSPVTSGSPSESINLNVGNNVITTVVVSEDQTVTNTYLLSAIRAASITRWWDGGSVDIAGNGDGASAGGSGVWDTTTQNWDQGSGQPHGPWDNAAGNIAVFGGTAGTVTNQGVTVGGMIFTASYTVISNTITFATAGSISNSAAATITAALAGTGPISKDGGGVLTLGGSNTFTGGIVLNGGTLKGGSPAFNANPLTVNSSGTLDYAVTGGLVLNGITLNNGSILSVQGNTQTITVTTAVTGTGGISLTQAGGGADYVFLNSTSNTFTGPIRYGVTAGNQNGQLTVNSLADAVSFGAGNIIFGTTAQSHDFTYGTGAIAPLTLNNRQFELAGTQAAQSINNSSSQAFTINSDLLVTGTGNKILTVGGTGAGVSTFAGKIADGTGSVITLNKINSGTWALAGTNTYSGATSVTAGKLVVVVGGSSSNSSVTVSGGTNSVSVTDNTKRWTCAGLTHSAASTLEFGFGSITPSTTVAPLQVNGNVTFSVTPTVNLTGSSLTGLAGGLYPLVTWTGTLSGSAPTSATLPSGSGTLVLDNANRTLFLYIPAAGNPEPLTWQGPAGNEWKVNDNTATYWKNASAVTTNYQETTTGGGFTYGNSVLFSNGPGGVVALNTNVYPSSVLLSGSSNYTFTGTGSIGGGGGLTKAGTATQTLATANSYVGPTTVNAGTLRLAHTNAIAGSSVLALANSTTLQLRSDTAATLTTPVTKPAGTVAIDVGSLSSGSGQTLTLGGTISYVAAASSTINITGSNGYVLGISNMFVNGGYATGLGNSFTLNPTTANVSIGHLAGNTGFSGGYTNNVVVALDGTTAGNSIGDIAETSSALNGTVLTLNKSNTSTWTVGTLKGYGSYRLALAVQAGTLTVTGDIYGVDLKMSAGGVLNLQKSGNLFTSPGGEQNLISQLQGTINNTSGGAITFASNPAITFAGDFTLGGGSINFGSGAVSLGATRQVTVQNTATTLTVGGAISGATFGLTKAGPGTLVLSGNNTYTGATTVSNGTLVINGSLTNQSAVTVAGGALAGTGTIQGTVTVQSGATLQPGNPTGKLTISSNLTITAGATNLFALGTSSASVTVTGNLTYAGTVVVTDAGGFGPGTNTLFTYTGALTDNGITVHNPLPGGNTGALDTNTAGRVKLIVTSGGGSPAVARFTVSPGTNGVVGVTLFSFTDTSSNAPTSWNWNFGDFSSATVSNPTHTFTNASTFTVSLVASNAFGGSSYTTNITVISVQQSWQNYYGVAADASDPLGKGFSNYDQFLAGFNPTNPAAYPHIIAVTDSGNDLVITYLGANGDTSYPGGPFSRTNVLEYTTGTGAGGFTNNFAGASQTNILSGGTGTGVVTNFVDPNGATFSPSRYYRVRVLAP